MDILQQAIDVARNFVPMSEETRKAFISGQPAAAAKGEYEIYKTLLYLTVLHAARSGWDN